MAACRCAFEVSFAVVGKKRPLFANAGRGSRVKEDYIKGEETASKS